MPPIATSVLMHFFHHPEDCEDADWCYKQIPKRIREKPNPGVEPDKDTAWGLYFEEGFDYQKFFNVAFVGFVGSFGAGLYWIIHDKDIKTAVAVSSYLLTFWLFSVGILQAALK
jgi:hypothetical protein